MAASEEVRAFFSAAGKKGGAAGKGSPARAKAASYAALVRWSKYRAANSGGRGGRVAASSARKAGK